VKPTLRPGRNTVYAEGLNRLRAARRLSPQITGRRVCGHPRVPLAASVWEFGLPHGRLTFMLTVEHYCGFSGEGSLLTALAAPNVAEDVDLVSALLAFDPRIDESRLAREANLPEPRVRAALAVLGASGGSAGTAMNSPGSTASCPTTRTASNATTPAW